MVKLICNQCGRVQLTDDPAMIIMKRHGWSYLCEECGRKLDLDEGEAMNEQELKRLEVIAKDCPDYSCISLMPQDILDIIAEIRRLKNWQARAVGILKYVPVGYEAFRELELPDDELNRINAILEQVKKLIAEAEGE